MQKSIFPQKIQKSLYITTKSLYTNSKFKHNYLENYNNSEHAVKTKNAPLVMLFPNISFLHMVVNYWTDPLIAKINI
jgi:Rad3-related DNA helicase